MLDPPSVEALIVFMYGSRSAVDAPLLIDPTRGKRVVAGASATWFDVVRSAQLQEALAPKGCRAGQTSGVWFDVAHR